MQDDYKIPRLYIQNPLEQSAWISLEKEQAHYIKNVMRRKEGDPVRLFNGLDGEYVARITQAGKKDVHLQCERQSRSQPSEPVKIHLLFSPLKKHRMDQVIEKTVELGVTDLHPVLTNRTEVRTLKDDRITAQIIEAAEQSERLEIPRLHPLVFLKQKLTDWQRSTPIFWGAEGDKDDAHTLSPALNAGAFLIGPVGGFDEDECEYLKRQDFIRPISLGPRILRAETACIVCMVMANPKGS